LVKVPTLSPTTNHTKLSNQNHNEGTFVKRFPPFPHKKHSPQNRLSEWQFDG